jgi:hypothetical protein
MMNAIMRLILVSVLMVVAGPAYSDSFSQYLICEQDDDASSQDLEALASKWLKAARGMKGGDKLQVYLHFPVVAQMGEADFSFVLTAPSLEAWGVFMEGYEGSAAQKMDAEWDELAACPNSALFRTVKVK